MNKDIIDSEDCVCEICNVSNEQGLLCINDSLLCADCTIKFCMASDAPVTITGVLSVSEQDNVQMGNEG